MRDEIGVRDRAADERAHDLAGDLRVRPPGERGDLLGRETRPGLRHIEAAVAGKPGERHVDEAERGGFASGGNVAHRDVLGSRRRTLVGRATRCTRKP